MSYRIGIAIVVVFFGRYILNQTEILPFRKLAYQTGNNIKRQQYFLLCIFSVPFIFIGKLGFLYLFGYGAPLLKSIQYRKKLKLRLRYEFSIWLRNLSVYLKQNTVYHALMKTYHLVPTLFREEVDTLIERIQDNPDDREAFTGFMARYEQYDIQYMMKQLYRYATISSTDAQDQLLRMVQNANVFIQKSRTDSYALRISSRHWIGFLPLLLVSLVFMILMAFLIANVLGGGWN